LIDLYITLMEKLILVVVLLALTQSAPADDKMTRIPVDNLLSRDTPPALAPICMQAIWMWETLIDHFIMSLWNRSMGQAMQILSHFGSMVVQGVLRFSVLLT
jgi:hypothetical protein